MKEFVPCYLRRSTTNIFCMQSIPQYRRHVSFRFTRAVSISIDEMEKSNIDLIHASHSARVQVKRSFSLHTNCVYVCDLFKIKSFKYIINIQISLPSLLFCIRSRNQRTCTCLIIVSEIKKKRLRTKCECSFVYYRLCKD